MSELIPKLECGDGEVELSFEELEGIAGGSIAEGFEIQSNCSGDCGP